MVIVEQLRFIDAGLCKNGPGTYYFNGHEATVINRASNVGGSRLWLRCACGRTVKRLYFYGKWLRCRHCLRLGYQSQLVDVYTRQIWREEKLRKLLPCGARRPKGMHRATYRRIKAMIRDAQELQDCYFSVSIMPALRRFK